MLTITKYECVYVSLIIEFNINSISKSILDLSQHFQFQLDSFSCISIFICGTHLSLVPGLRTKYLVCRFCLLIADILKDLSINTVDKVFDRLIKSYDRRNAHKLRSTLGY